MPFRSWAFLFISEHGRFHYRMASLKTLLIQPVEDDAVNWRSRLAGALIACLLVGLVFYFSFHHVTYQWNWAAVYKYRWNLFSGWLVTIGISFAALGLSTV